MPADQGRSDEALRIPDAPRELPLPVERLVAEGDAQLRHGDDLAALRACGEVLMLDPENREARTTMAAIVDRQRGPHGAGALAGAPPERRADKAAALTRRGIEVRPAEPRRRFERTDRAIAAEEALLEELARDSGRDPALVRRLRLDRMVGLCDRVRMEEVAAEAAALRRDGPLPPFALEAEADARMFRRQPEAALVLYEAVLAAEPANPRAADGRVLAFLEAERLREASAAADAMAAPQPRSTPVLDDPATTPNPEALLAASSCCRCFSSPIRP